MHAAMPASGLYRQHLGIDKNLGEFTSTSHWILPMRTCWICFHNAGSMLVSRLDPGTGWIAVERAVFSSRDQETASLAARPIQRQMSVTLHPSRHASQAPRFLL